MSGKPSTFPPEAHKTSHQDGGSDEVSVAGLSGTLADPQTPAAHKTSHQDGGTDEISVQGLSGTLTDAQTPAAHKTSHQDGGTDEISVQGLSGLLADKQNCLSPGSGRILFLTPDTYESYVGTWGYLLDANQFLNGFLYNTTGAQNDEVVYSAYMGAGTYTFRLFGKVDVNLAILTLLIDGVSVGTVDTYAGAMVRNFTSAITGIVISTAGLKTITLRAATKNPDSSGYYLMISVSSFGRTA